MTAPSRPTDAYRRPRGVARAGWLTAALGSILLIGWFDHVTGPAVGFALLYMVPVVLVAARLGAGPSLAVAGAAAVAWLIDDLLDVRVPLTASVWNGFTRLAIFTGMAWLVSGQRDAGRRLAVLAEQLRTVAQREARTARIDVLTGLPNSRGFHEALRTELARARRHAHPIGLLVVDLDNFKAVNDRYGHERGDACLREVADALRGAVRAADIAARLGGDEFAVLLWDAEVAETETVAARICAGVRAVGERYPGCDLGASVGVAYAVDVPATPEELLRHADTAMYAAKHAGKGRVVRGDAPPPPA